MVPGGGLPAGHLALLYDQSLRKELSPWNKADKIGRQWRCCSLSWRLLSPRVWGMWRERTVGVWPEVRAVWAPAASLLTRFLKTTTLYGFKMPTPGKRRTDKDEEGRSFTSVQGFSQQLNVIPALFEPWRVMYIWACTLLTADIAPPLKTVACSLRSSSS